MYKITYDTKKNGFLVSVSKEFKTLTDAMNFARGELAKGKVYGKPLINTKE